VECRLRCIPHPGRCIGVAGVDSAESVSVDIVDSVESVSVGGVDSVDSVG
jgi:hypothetical protein